MGNRACRKAQRLILFKRTFNGSASRAVRQYFIKKARRVVGAAEAKAAIVNKPTIRERRPSSLSGRGVSCGTVKGHEFS